MCVCVPSPKAGLQKKKLLIVIFNIAKKGGKKKQVKTKKFTRLRFSQNRVWVKTGFTPVKVIECYR